MKKDNLIIIPGFGANSIILRGLIEYLKECFNVYFIDLPGHIHNEKPLREISIKNYSEFVERKIGKLKLDNYVICGISFGFSIINKCNFGSRYRGIVALAPYTNSTCLKISTVNRYILVFILSFLIATGVISKIWGTTVVRKAFRILILPGYPEEVEEAILSEMDPRTYTELAKVLLKDKSKVLDIDIPCVFVKYPIYCNMILDI